MQALPCTPLNVLLQEDFATLTRYSEQDYASGKRSENGTKRCDVREPWFVGSHSDQECVHAADGRDTR